MISLFFRLFGFFYLSCSLNAADMVPQRVPPSFNTVNNVVLIKGPYKTEPSEQVVLFEIKSALESLGTTTIFSRQCYCVRDMKINTASNGILRINNLYDEAIGDRVKTNYHFWHQTAEFGASNATKHPNFDRCSGVHLTQPILAKTAAEGYSLKCRNQAYDVLDNTTLATSNLDIKIIQSRSFYEGGNIIISKNNKGVTKILIGESSLIQTHHLLRELGFFAQERNPNSAVYHAETNGHFVNPHGNTVSKLYQEGNISKTTVQLGKVADLKWTDAYRIFAEMVNCGIIASNDQQQNNLYAFAQFWQTSKVRDKITSFHGEREFIQKILWPEEFGVSKNDILVIPQAGYHSDLFMFAADDKIFLQDFATTELVLADILCNIDLKLGVDEITALNSYADNAIQLRNDLFPVYEEIKKRLINAGFTIIKTPGQFFGTLGDKPININFINALLGYSPVTKHPYFICLGAKVGNKLGDELMSAFTRFLKGHIPQVDVYFVGKTNISKKGGINDYSSAMHFFNESSGRDTGVHCMTYELQTAAPQIGD